MSIFSQETNNLLTYSFAHLNFAHLNDEEKILLERTVHLNKVLKLLGHEPETDFEYLKKLFKEADEVVKLLDEK